MLCVLLCLCLLGGVTDSAPVPDLATVARKARLSFKREYPLLENGRFKPEDSTVVKDTAPGEALVESTVRRGVPVVN